MKRALVVFVLALALLLSACRGAAPTPMPTPFVAVTEPAATPVPASPEPTELPPPATGEAASLQDVESATIRIQADGTFYSPDGNEYSTVSSGSGFIIDPEGIAVTNNHVVEGAALLKVWVSDESESRNARILGVSECADLAVIDIEGDGYPYLNWYEGEISPGLAVYAAGYPHGEPEYTLTQGIVTKAEADGDSDWASVDSALQHQAPIANGSSGGPLVTEEGQVVAVNYASGEDALESVAITGPQALPIIERLQADEDVDSIGVNPQAVAFEDGLNGVWVTSVRAGSPADKAGLEAGDMITRLAGLSFLTDETLDGYTMADYCDILRTQGPEATIDIRVVRFDTEEVLEGQVNGRSLEPVFSFADAGEEDVTETEETYSDYVELQDDTGAIRLEAPATWSDVNGGPMLEDDGTPYAASILAAPDLDAYRKYQAPGVRFAAMASRPGQYTAEGTLEVFDYSDDCDYVGREPYSDSLYQGAYDHYTNCGGNDGALYVVASLPEDETHLNVVIIQALTGADLEAADHVLATFQVVGGLPGSGQGTEAEPPSGETIEIGVVNDTTEPVCEIYLVSSDSDGWGENWLGSDRLEPGYYWAQDMDASGSYDLTAADCEKATLGVLWELEEDAALALGGPDQTVSLLFENNTTDQICEVYVSPSTSDDWGENWLGQPDTYVDPDQAWRFWLEPGTYDLLARDCQEQDVAEVDGADLTGHYSWSLGDGEQEGGQGTDAYAITVANRTPESICAIYIVPSDTEDWGENWLGSDPLVSGSYWSDYLDAGVTYQLYATDCTDAILGAEWEIDDNTVVTFGATGRTVNLFFDNQTDDKICEIYASPSTSDDWGDNLLGPDDTHVKPDSFWRFWLEPGTYDLLARDCDGQALEQFDEVDLSEDRSWTLGDEEEGSQGADFVITVYNETPEQICSVQLAPSESDEWGENRVAGNPVYSGEWREFAVEAGGAYDLVVKDCGDAYLGALWEVEEAKILTLGGPERSIYLRVENSLTADICEIKISPSTADDWGENWLQEEGAVISDGTAWGFWLKPGTYDVLARDCQGEEIERHTNVDLTKNTRWAIPQE